MIIARVKNQNSDEMSLRAQARNRVTFSEEIEMDSLEHAAVNGLGLLGTIQEKNEPSSRDEEDDVNLNEFHEFDVSESGEKCHRDESCRAKASKKKRKIFMRSVMSVCDML